MDIELLKDALAFVESEVLPPPPQNRIQFAMVARREVPRAWKKMSFSFSRSLLRFLGCTRGAPVAPTKV